ncbi:MAG: dihydrofolate reductase [Betaproteobacteria bacterium]|nr:dihydrofolate reductase [Betaproteobacteria bacterium]
MIVAMDRRRVIGKDNRLPWHISEDLKRFRALTMGHPIVMGRKTFESIGRVLPGRLNIVVTRQTDYAAPDTVKVVNSLPGALAAAANAEEVFVIGGSDLYDSALPSADRLLITEVHGEFVGDRHFPPIDSALWQETARESRPAPGEGYQGYDFVTYERRVSSSP